MTEESTNVSITSGVKEKDPRGVAAGKRLGEISKQAKEAKRLERERQTQAQATKDCESDDGGGAGGIYVVGGLIVGGGGGHYPTCV